MTSFCPKKAALYAMGHLNEAVLYDLVLCGHALDWTWRVPLVLIVTEAADAMIGLVMTEGWCCTLTLDRGCRTLLL